MDAKHVCVIIPAMPPGAMASKGIIMIITLGPTAKIHGVMTSGRTENATPTPDQHHSFVQYTIVLVDSKS
jgi:hypothetical protein